MKARQLLDLWRPRRIAAATATASGAPVPEGPADTLALDQVGAQDALNALSYGTYVTDTQRTILFWSKAATRITGWEPKEVVGRSCADRILVHINASGQRLCAGGQCPLHSALRMGEETRQPMLLFAQHKDGYRIPVEVTVAPLCDRTGQRVGAVEVFRDLTRTVEDLRRAKIIQDYILRWEVPADERVRFEVRCRPQEVVGGDFHRVQAIGNDEYAVMVADAMGHGLISALYTVHIRSAWDECQAEIGSPARFLSRLNQRLYQLAGPEGYFATAVCLVLNAASGRLRYVRAGHPAPLLFRRTGQTQLLGGHSPAIGLLKSASYEEGELMLEAGDQMLLSTDGAVELANRDGELLGEQGFHQLLQDMDAPTLDLEAIERKLLRYVHPAGLPDDLTLLSLFYARGGKSSNSRSRTCWERGKRSRHT